MVYGLADVVQQSGAAGELGIQTELGSHDATEVGDFPGVLKDVLRVAGAVPEAADEPDDLFVNVVDPRDRRWRFQPASFTFCSSSFFTFSTTSSMRAGCMRPSEMSLLEGEPGDLPPDRIESGKDDRLRRVVDDQVDTGGALPGCGCSSLRGR